MKKRKTLPRRAQPASKQGASRQHRRTVSKQRAAMKDVSRRFQLLARYSRDVILFVRRADGRIVEASTSAVTHYGYSREELLRLTIHELRAPDTQALTPEQMALADSQSILFETVHRRKDGTTFPVEVSSRGARLGRTRILISIIRDITDRKRVEEARDRSEAKLRAVFRSLVEGVVFLNRKGMIEEINDAVHQLHGHTLQQFTDPSTDPRNQLLRRDGSPVPADDQPGMVALRTGQPVRNAEIGMRMPDGSVRWRLINAQPVRDEAAEMIGAVVSFFDITERRLAEQALEQARTELREHAEKLERTVQLRTGELQELVGELEHFSYSITHDLRAPLRAIRGYAEMLQETLGASVEPDAAMCLNRITGAAERMDLLITDALSYSRAVRQELPLGPVDLHGLIEGILDTYAEFQASRAHIRLDDTLPAVLGNEAGLTQCFSNLIGNAVKFVAPGKMPEIRIRAEIREHDGASPDGGTPAALPDAAHRTAWVRVWVEDKGIGIPAPMRTRIFDMFTRAHQAYPGTGIGLALVRKVVHRMGGRIGVESEVDQGSRFWIELRPA